MDITTTVFVVVVNPMRGQSEEQRTIGPFTSRDAAMTFVRNEEVEPYKDSGDNSYVSPAPNSYTYQKCYRKGGPLEWFNGINVDEVGFLNHGIHEVTYEPLSFEEWLGDLTAGMDIPQFT